MKQQQLQGGVTIPSSNQQADKVHSQQQQQQRHASGPAMGSQATVKKSTGSFFEKHGLGGANLSSQASFGNPTAVSSKIVSKIHTTASSSYNMHRQNATRGDSNQAHIATLVQSNSNMASSGQASQQQQISRDKPSAKQFSQNMLSKSQQFATLQFNQAMLSQQSYLAQGNLGVLGSGGPPQMQQQNFIGQGVVTSGNSSLNSSASQLNASAQYDNATVENASSNNNDHQEAQNSGQASKRQVSRTSLGKRKNTAKGRGSGSGRTQGLVPHSQPTERTDGGVSNNSSQHTKVSGGMLPPSSQTSLGQKRYSVNSLGNTVAAQVTGNSSGGVSIGMHALAQQHPQMMTGTQLAKQANITKSESNNKLRRISNMKHKNGASDNEQQNVDCEQRNVNIVQSQMHTTNTTTPALMQQFSQQSQNSGQNFLQQSVKAHQSTASGMHIGAQKSIVSSIAHQVAPANMSNLTSFVQSHSERTSITDEAHTSCLINMHWPNAANNQHAQCSTERHTNNGQKSQFIQQLQSSKDTFGTTSQNSVTYHVSQNGGASTNQIHGGIFAKKQTKDKLFFVTDHKLYEQDTHGQNAATISAPAKPGAISNTDQNSIVGSAANNSAMIPQKSHNHTGNHSDTLHSQIPSHHVMQYDIEMEDIQVNPQQQTSQPLSQSQINSHNTITTATNNNNNTKIQHQQQPQSLYLNNKACKKQQQHQQHLYMNSSSNLMQSNGSMDSQHQAAPQQQQNLVKQRGAAAAPVSTSNLKQQTTSSQKQQQSHHVNSIVCPIYQSKDIRLMTGQVAQTTKHHAGGHIGFTAPGSKTDQKDVKRGIERRESKQGATSGNATAARRSMSDDMHEDVYMAKTEHQKARKRTFKTSSVVETQSNQSASQNKHSVNSSDTYERSHQQQLKKSSNQQRQSKQNLVLNPSKASWPQDELYHQTSNAHQVQQQNQSNQQYSETSSTKGGGGNQSLNQERRDAEPLADKLLYLTNQACQSKVKSKSQLTQSMKSSGALRKGIKSPQGSQSTLQEPSAKAMPTSSKVKISQKFNKFEQSNPSMKMGPGYTSKQSLFQTKQLKKQGSGPLQDFKEGAFKSPDCRHLQMKKNGSISYAMLPRHVIPHSELKAQKKMKSPSPSIKLQESESLQRMRSPQNGKAQNIGNSSQKHQNQDTILHQKYHQKADQNKQSQLDSKQSQAHAHNQSQQHFEARRLSQQRTSHMQSHKPPQFTSSVSSSNQQNPNAANKSHLIETSGGAGQSSISGLSNKQHPQSVTNSISGSKRISFSDLHSAGKVLSNEGADEAKKLYCMVDSRKSSQSSLHNAQNLASNLNQVQILQVDSSGNAKASALSKVQLKTKDKLQNYMKPAGFLSQSPKAKKPSAVSKGTTKFYEQNSMLMSQNSGNNANTSSQSKLSGTKHKYVSQIHSAYSQQNHHAHRELLKNSASMVGSIATAHKALLQIQAPKVVHLQSPPSRILVKASPRVSPNPKIRHSKQTAAGAIQTCKVSIDTLQKGPQPQHKQVNRAHSKEFLKTIKLIKRASNSPSPTPSTNPQYIKSSQGSPTNASLQNQLLQSQQNSAARGIKSQYEPDQQQIQKNYMSAPLAASEVVQVPSQNTKQSSQVRQSNNSQNNNSNKLVTRLQMRGKAKEPHLQNNPVQECSAAVGTGIASVSERQSIEKGGNNSAKHQNNGSFLGQASQSMLIKHHSGVTGYPSEHSHAVNQQMQQSSSLAEHLSSAKTSSQQQYQQPNYETGNQSGKTLAGSKAASVSNLKERTNIVAKDKRLAGSYKGQHQEDQEKTSQNHSQLSGLSIPLHKDQIQQKPPQLSNKVQAKNAPIPKSTPSKRLKAQQVVPVLAKHAEDEDNDGKDDLLDSGSKAAERNVYRQSQNVGLIPQNSNPTQQAHGFSESRDLAVRAQSKATAAAGSGVMTSMSNEEQREQAKFVKDLEKLKRMFKLHFQNYNTAPPTTNEFYRIGRVLGKGAFGKVSLAMHKLSEQLVAIKSMSRETLRDEVDQRRRTKLEMGILKQCNHPNVVRLFDTFETTKHICFVIELCSGGDLFLYIKKRRRLKEDIARFFFKQLIEGLAYIHNAKKVVHRDIKLENILLDATGNVKICDFGVSRQLQTGRERMKEQCGTPAYIAPEILLDEGYSGFKVDMWSAGVCLYAMLIGSVPFKASTMSQLQALIIKGEYDFKFQTNANSKNMQNPKAATTLLSEEVQDLISKLLQTDPDKRLSAVETLHHPWLQQTNPDLDVYTDKEKQLIQKEYMRLNLKLSQRIQQGFKGGNSRVQSQTYATQQETEQILFTEHQLETRVGEDEPNLQNQEEKSFILAPFNSVKSMFIDQSNQIKEIKKDDPPFKWPRDVTDLIAPRRIIKFSTKCREKNRIYEQNNNADLDNGVYNEFVNEQEREEGALMKQAQQDAEDEANKDYDSHGVSVESQQQRRLMRSLADDEGEGFYQEDEYNSEDSLERSFKDTELASDDEKAVQQVAEQRRLLSGKKPNEEALSLLENSSNSSSNELVLDTDEQIGQIQGTPVREHMQSPLSLSGAPSKHLKAQSKAASHQLQQSQNQTSQAQIPGVLSKQKSRSLLRAAADTPQVQAKKITVREYVEPVFVIDKEVVDRIQKANVIPRWFLLQELQALIVTDAAASANRDKSLRINYVTATYFLLLKRRELEEIQRRQESKVESRLTVRNDHQSAQSIEKSNY